MGNSLGSATVRPGASNESSPPCCLGAEDERHEAADDIGGCSVDNFREYHDCMTAIMAAERSHRRRPQHSQHQSESSMLVPAPVMAPIARLSHSRRSTKASPSVISPPIMAPLVLQPTKLRSVKLPPPVKPPVHRLMLNFEEPSTVRRKKQKPVPPASKAKPEVQAAPEPAPPLLRTSNSGRVVVLDPNRHRKTFAEFLRDSTGSTATVSDLPKQPTPIASKRKGTPRSSTVKRHLQENHLASQRKSIPPSHSTPPVSSSVTLPMVSPTESESFRSPQSPLEESGPSANATVERWSSLSVKRKFQTDQLSAETSPSSKRSHATSLHPPESSVPSLAQSAQSDHEMQTVHDAVDSVDIPANIIVPSPTTSTAGDTCAAASEPQEGNQRNSLVNETCTEEASDDDVVVVDVKPAPSSVEQCALSQNQNNVKDRGQDASDDHCSTGTPKLELSPSSLATRNAVAATLSTERNGLPALRSCEQKIPSPCSLPRTPITFPNPLLGAVSSAARSDGKTSLQARRTSGKTPLGAATASSVGRLDGSPPSQVKAALSAETKNCNSLAVSSRIPQHSLDAIQKPSSPKMRPLAPREIQRPVYTSTPQRVSLVTMNGTVCVLTHNTAVNNDTGATGHALSQGSPLARPSTNRLGRTAVPASTAIFPVSLVCTSSSNIPERDSGDDEVICIGVMPPRPRLG
jgi:hypothetical protein